MPKRNKTADVNKVNKAVNVIANKTNKTTNPAVWKESSDDRSRSQS